MYNVIEGLFRNDLASLLIYMEDSLFPLYSESLLYTISAYINHTTHTHTHTHTHTLHRTELTQRLSTDLVPHSSQLSAIKTTATLLTTLTSLPRLHT